MNAGPEQQQQPPQHHDEEAADCAVARGAVCDGDGEEEGAACKADAGLGVPQEEEQQRRQQQQQQSNGEGARAVVVGAGEKGTFCAARGGGEEGHDEDGREQVQQPRRSVAELRAELARKEEELNELRWAYAQRKRQHLERVMTKDNNCERRRSASLPPNVRIAVRNKNRKNNKRNKRPRAWALSLIHISEPTRP